MVSPLVLRDDQVPETLRTAGADLFLLGGKEESNQICSNLKKFVTEMIHWFPFCFVLECDLLVASFLYLSECFVSKSQE